jgi:hypothetical protein
MQNFKKSIDMKNSLLNKPLFLKAIVLVTCFMLVMFYNKSKAQSRAVFAGYTMVKGILK